MFENMIIDELLALRDAVADQADAVAADGPSIGIGPINARLAMIDRELARRTEEERKARAREWIWSMAIEDRCCPLCGEVLRSDGLTFAKHLVADVRRAERLTGKKFVDVGAFAAYQEWTGFKLPMVLKSQSNEL